MYMEIGFLGAQDSSRCLAIKRVFLCTFLSRLQNLMSLDVQYLKTELSVVNLMLKLAEHRGEAERK